MEHTHTLLKRQLKRYFGDSFSIPQEWQKFFDAVNEAYVQFDIDKEILERSLDLSSQELLQTNSEMRAVIQAFPDLIFRTDYRGKILEYKFSDQAHLFSPHEKLIGKNIQSIPLRDVSIKFKESINKVRDTKHIVSTEYSLETGGQVNFYEARLVPLLENQIMVIIRNITDRKEFEEQLRQMQKMDAIGTLAGGIAHDFNNILTAVIGYGNLLKGGVTGDSQLTGYIDQVLISSEKAAALTQNLLAFSRRQIINPSPVNINEIVKKLGTLLLRVIGEDIELKMVLSSEDLVVMADSIQMEQILLNLAANARDAMPDGGTLTIKTARVELDDEFLRVHGYGVPGPYAFVLVEDTGQGMDEETKERIFEPFFTTKRVGKGTGLGLSMVYGIVKLHEGYIHTYSELGNCTVFKIYLPLTQKMYS